MHTRLVPMQQTGDGYSIDPAAAGWFELPVTRGFAGYGLARALGLVLDAMRGLSALNETTTESGEPFAHGEFSPLQFRVDPLGVCRLVPLTARHYVSEHVTPPSVTLGFLSPERLIAERVGLRADVFSAGVLLWEALAGRRLIEADRAEIIVEHWLSRPIRVPTLPPQLAWATPLKAEVERALCVNQQRRFADCAEFSEVILRLVQDRVASHDEIAAFFRSNFNSSPRSAASPPGAAVSLELPIANRNTTVRMLPAVSQAHTTSLATSGAEAPSTVSSIPPTTTEPPLKPLQLTSRRRSRPVLVAVMVTSIVGATAAVKIMASQPTQLSGAWPRTASRRAVPTFVDNSGSAAASTGIGVAESTASTDARSSDETSRRAGPSSRASEVTPSATHSVAPPSRAPSTRPTSGGGLPRGKDYGI